MSLCVFRDEVPNALSGRLYSLEVMLKQLNTDLEKVPFTPERHLGSMLIYMAVPLTQVRTETDNK